MKPIPGMPPAASSELARVQDRLSFVYLERCTIHRDGNAITVSDERGVIHIPGATIGAVMLGPGTRITHQGMMLLADSGATSVWVGEHGVRYYAHGRPLATTSRLLEAQAAKMTNQSSRLQVARRMYEMRFPGEDVAGLTMQQLRGREGARVKRAYRESATSSGVEWTRRDYRPEDFSSSDAVNQALTAATTCLYGVVHAAVVALGCSPGLGFVHTGQARSFVFDIADLYKVEMAVPIAFECAGEDIALDDLPGEVRRRMRDSFRESKLITRCVRDIQTLLLDTELEDEVMLADVVELWDGGSRRVSGGTSYDDFDVPW